MMPCIRNILRQLLLIVLLFWGGITLCAETFEEANARHETRLESAIARLTAERKRIKDEQIPMVRSLNESRREAKTLRGELAEFRAIEDSKHLDLQTLQERVVSLKKEYDYITFTLFGEYFASYDAGLSMGEREEYGDRLRQLNLFLEKGGNLELETLEQSLEVVWQSLEQIKSVVGGKSYKGESLNLESQWVKGTFVQAGPVLYFVDGNGEEAGLVEESASLRPRIRLMDEKSSLLLIDFASGASDLLPIDPSLQNAMLMIEAKDGFFEHLKKGGVWVYPIVFFAVIASLVAVFKFVQIFSIRQPTALIAHHLAGLIKHGNISEAAELAAKQSYPTRDMLCKAVEHAGEPVELIEEVMYERMLAVQPKLDRFLNVIAVTAATAPLLGLLGTVTGIIKTFKLMNVYGAGDPKPLISGISEALITTELGLVLAIPALLIHALLSRKKSGIMARLENISVAMINSLSRKVRVGSDRKERHV